MAVEDQYQEIFQDVKAKVEKAKAEQNCTQNDSHCLFFDEKYVNVIENEVPKPQVCSIIEPAYKEFFVETITSDGLTCMSFCDPSYAQPKSCNDGKCVIQRDVGPQCLCPETDIFMYTGASCTGKISKAGVYAGVGVSLAVLFIVIITVSFYLVREKRKKNKDDFFRDSEDLWSHDTDDQWTAQNGIFNLNLNIDSD
ncbi:mucin-3B-like [Rana temporaria]|uniref:mucin-3B-like n=1 Tax=Rana temporaria TaxID=8407 RepID=UPI001AACCDFB|nr:mucin-3B-like [Rana temporaria]